MTDAAPGPDAAAGILDPEERALVRSLIMADPEVVLGDERVMRLLIGEPTEPGRRIVDLRDRLVERLETRLRRVVHANRSMIAAAYENVAGTQALHRAVVALIDATSIGAFLRCLTEEVPDLIGVEDARLCLEAEVDATRPASGFAAGSGARVLAVPEGAVDAYMTLGPDPASERAVLREAAVEAEAMFGMGTPVRSEALVRLDIDGATGLMVFGSSDIDRFGPDQGTDLLRFFGETVERLLAQRLRAAGLG